MEIYILASFSYPWMHIYMEIMKRWRCKSMAQDAGKDKK